MCGCLQMVFLTNEEGDLKNALPRYTEIFFVDCHCKSRYEEISSETMMVSIMIVAYEVMAKP